MKTKTGIALGVAAGFLAGLVLGMIRLEQRSEFREKIRPLVEDDLSDFASELDSSGSLMVGQAMAKREKRIAQVKLFNATHYRVGRDLIANLMEAENFFLADREVYPEFLAKLEGDETQLRLLQLRWNLASTNTEWCSAANDFLSALDSALADFKVATSAPILIKGSRNRGAAAWDLAYGWIKWLGMDIRPENPFRSIREFEPIVTAKAASTWKQDEEQKEEKIKSLRQQLMAKGCQVTR